MATNITLFLRNFLLYIIIGSIALGFWIQRDPWIQHTILLSCQAIFNDSLDCSFKGSLQSANLFVPMFVLKNVTVNPLMQKKETWHWHAGEFRMGFSWIHLLAYGTLDFWIQINDLTAYSETSNNDLAIVEHINTLIKGQHLETPSFLKSLRFHNLALTIKNKSLNGYVSLSAHVLGQKIDDYFKLSCICFNGNSFYKDCCLVRDVQGSLAIKARDGFNGPEVEVHFNGNGSLAHLADKSRCIITGNWNINKGDLCVTTDNHDPLIHHGECKYHEGIFSYTLDAEVPVEYWWRLYLNSPHLNTVPLTGKQHIFLQGSVDNAYNPFTCTIAMEDCSYNNMAIDGIINIHKKKEPVCITGQLTTNNAPLCKFYGAWNGSTNKAIFSCYNNDVITFPFFNDWQIQPGNLHAKIRCFAQGKLVVDYNCIAQHALLNTKLPMQGKTIWQGNKIVMNGRVREQRYTCVADTAQYPYVKKAFWTDEHNNALISIEQNKDDQRRIDGAITVPGIRMIVKQACGYEIQGKGSMLFDVHCNDQNDCTIQFNLDKGIIRLPQTYNWIDGFKGSCFYDYAKHMITMKSIQCSLHTGKVTIPYATCFLDNVASIKSLYMPFIFDRCLLNMKKNLFAMITGNLVFSYAKNELPLLSGHLFCDHGQLKENIFAPSLQKQLFSYAGGLFENRTKRMLCNLTLETKDAITIDTSFLQGNLHMNLHLKDNIFEPAVSGNITLVDGELQFPYKPMNITEGKLLFSPQQSYNPRVELIAKNTIHQCLITLHITGSLLDHAFVLESTPPLSEEQIIALLLVGSYRGSLSAMMPALIMQNLKNLMFSVEQKELFDVYFKPFAKSLNVHLIPSFTDQTGRGGLRGGIEIDVNDRCRALIMKNFSLTEDTRFEVEYVVTDDITVRGIRDERRDVGTEVEMRWKW